MNLLCLINELFLKKSLRFCKTGHRASSRQVKAVSQTNNMRAAQTREGLLLPRPQQKVSKQVGTLPTTWKVRFKKHQKCDRIVPQGPNLRPRPSRQSRGAGFLSSRPKMTTPTRTWRRSTACPWTRPRPCQLPTTARPSYPRLSPTRGSDCPVG